MLPYPFSVFNLFNKTPTLPGPPSLWEPQAAPSGPAVITWTLFTQFSFQTESFCCSKIWFRHRIYFFWDFLKSAFPKTWSLRLSAPPLACPNTVSAKVPQPFTASKNSFCSQYNFSGDFFLCCFLNLLRDETVREVSLICEQLG